jgi:hypothetical protein
MVRRAGCCGAEMLTLGLCLAGAAGLLVLTRARML